MIMGSARGEEHHTHEMLTQLLTEKPTYQRVLDAFYNLFGTRNIVFTRREYLFDPNAEEYLKDENGRYVRTPCLTDLLATKTGLAPKKVREAYGWLVDIDLLEECGVESLGGGSKSEQVCLRQWNVNYVSPNVKRGKPLVKDHMKRVFSIYM
jgi:hypothetical protein